MKIELLLGRIELRKLPLIRITDDAAIFAWEKFDYDGNGNIRDHRCSLGLIITGMHGLDQRIMRLLADDFAKWW